MASCSRCGADLPDGARFCPSCGNPVEASSPIAEERRIVSVLFVDLVGFTERSDRADPEDVRRTLLPFHRRAKEDLERFGGTLDKFIGDAVLGVFGAPVAHEDDPVRAVRAALAILDSMEDLRRTDPHLQVRIAVNTGEAVVSFGTGPQAGEAVAGDVVNTASRMQALAPHGSVVIGETTLRAVRDRFDVEPLPPATVKGKSEPLEVWRVVAERQRAEPERTPFVGRERELASLADAFEDAARSGSCRIVAVLGDAGLGKSRLAGELARRLGDRARRLTGRCPPYGEGVTFAPIEETVRAIAGIGPQEDSAAAAERLEAIAARAEVRPADRRWLASTLDAVLAIGEGGERAIPAEEVARAWATLLADAASERPLFLVLEDVHWASSALVEVIAEAAALLESSPVLVLATARPDARGLFEGWGSDRARVSIVLLEPLGESETRELLAGVVPDAAAGDGAWATVVERSAGNPLYAIEFARMLGESGRSDADALETPTNVQAVIAARLDAIAPEVRALVHDASTLGEEVWPDALATVSERPIAEVRDGLLVLEGRGLLERRTSSIPGTGAYAFSHALIRDVAYGRLPRAARARRHLAAATWLEGAGGERADEWAESLARHYATAAELADAANETDVLERSRGPALRWLAAASDRAARMDPAAAFDLAERALALAPDEAPERLAPLWRSGHAGRRSGRLDAADVLARYEEGLRIARDADDDVAVGEWLIRAGVQLGAMGETDRSRAALAEAVEVLERHPPGRPLARAYAYRAEEELFAGDIADAAAFADRALELLGDPRDEIAVMALHLRGDARCSSGDVEGGIADLEEALRRSEENGGVSDIVSSRNYLAEWRWATEGPRAGLAEWESALELAERRGIHSQGMYTKGGALAALLDAGEWDRVLEWSEQLLAMPPGQLDTSVAVNAHVARTHVLLARGRRREVIGADALVELAERTQELHALAPALVAAAAIELADGAADRAAAWLERFEAVTTGVAPEYRAIELTRAVRLCLRAGRPDIAERMVAVADPRVPRDRLRLDVARAMLAELGGADTPAGAFAEVAARLRDSGDPFEEAMALLGQVRVSGDDAARERARELLGGLGVARVEDQGPLTTDSI
jgi:class 3 adenylate cyclase